MKIYFLLMTIRARLDKTINSQPSVDVRVNRDKR